MYFNLKKKVGSLLVAAAMVIMNLDAIIESSALADNQYISKLLSANLATSAG